MRYAHLLLIGCVGCAQATIQPAPDLSALLPVDLASHEVGPPAITDLACQQLGQAFSATPSGWFLLGSSVMDTVNKRLQLTDTYADKSGTAFALTPVAVSSFEVTFKYYIGNGGGGEGLAFVLAKAANVTALGPKGTGSTLGYVGMDGYAIELDTAAGGVGDPNANHVALTRANTGAHLLSGTPPFPLHCNCERQARIRYTGNHLTVTIDSTVVLDGTVTGFAPDTYYVGFSAATGGNDDVHAVRDFKLALGAIGSGCAP